MHARRTWQAVCAGAALIAGCESTGDPRQGGLFGWSEERAIARQEQLGQTDQLARDQLAQEQRRTAMLSTQQVGRVDEAASLEAELGRLLKENGALDAQVRSLLQRQQVGQEQVARLRRMLADNAQLRQATRAPASGRTSSTTAQVDAVSEQNAKLHRELMILLQR